MRFGLLMAVIAGWLITTPSFGKTLEYSSAFCNGKNKTCTVNRVDHGTRRTDNKTSIFHKKCLININNKALYERCTWRAGLPKYKPMKKYKPKMEYKPVKKNYVYGLFGAGIQNELGVYKTSTSAGDKYEIKQRIGPVWGAGYDRLFTVYDYDFIAGAQLQTNVTGTKFTRQFTGLLKLGFGF